MDSENERRQLDGNGAPHIRRLEDRVNKLELWREGADWQLARLVSHIKSEEGPGGTRDRAAVRIQEQFSSFDKRIDKFEANVDGNFEKINLRQSYIEGQLQGLFKMLWKLAALVATVQVAANALLNHFK